MERKRGAQRNGTRNKNTHACSTCFSILISFYFFRSFFNCEHSFSLSFSLSQFPPSFSSSLRVCMFSLLFSMLSLLHSFLFLRIFLFFSFPAKVTSLWPVPGPFYHSLMTGNTKKNMISRRYLLLSINL